MLSFLVSSSPMLKMITVSRKSHTWTFTWKDQLGFNHYWVTNQVIALTVTKASKCHYFWKKMWVTYNELILIDEWATFAQWIDIYYGYQFIIPATVPIFPNALFSVMGFSQNITVSYKNYSASEVWVIL